MAPRLQRTISPIDGSVAVTRELADDAAPRARARRPRSGPRRHGRDGPRRAHGARSPHGRRPHGPRRGIAQELAQQMGRPVRDGPEGDPGRLRRARPGDGRARARGPGRRRRRRRAGRRAASSAREPLGVVLVHRALELPLPHRGQRGRAGGAGRQRRAAQALRPDAAGRPSAWPRPSREAGLPDGVLPVASTSTTTRVARVVADAARRLRRTSPARSRAGTR